MNPALALALLLLAACADDLPPQRSLDEAEATTYPATEECTDLFAPPPSIVKDPPVECSKTPGFWCCLPTPDAWLEIAGPTCGAFYDHATRTIHIPDPARVTFGCDVARTISHEMIHHLIWENTQTVGIPDGDPLHTSRLFCECDATGGYC